MRPCCSTCALLAGHAGCAPLTCIPRVFALSIHMQFCKDIDEVGVWMPCRVGWHPLRHPPRKRGRHGQPPCTHGTTLLPAVLFAAHRNLSTACWLAEAGQELAKPFFLQPSIHRSANARYAYLNPPPFPHRVDIEATVKLLPKTTQNCQRRTQHV